MDSSLNNNTSPKMGISTTSHIKILVDHSDYADVITELLSLHSKRRDNDDLKAAVSAADPTARPVEWSFLQALIDEVNAPNRRSTFVPAWQSAHNAAGLGSQLSNEYTLLRYAVLYRLSQRSSAVQSTKTSDDFFRLATIAQDHILKLYYCDQDVKRLRDYKWDNK